MDPIGIVAHHGGPVLGIVFVEGWRNTKFVEGLAPESGERIQVPLHWGRSNLGLAKSVRLPVGMPAENVEGFQALLPDGSWPI